jgi:glycosyltransferase involved in cell wall biosynthesis
MNELSVILISRNQEWNIARLVESVLRETAPLPSTEIVLVDSASTDRTTEIAARYPITVLRLRPNQRLTAAAGRYVGYKRTTGNLVLFLDGDMELCQGWLEQAIAVMQSRSEVGVVCGRLIHRPVAPIKPADEPPEFPNADVAGCDDVRAGGAAMYRRSVMEQVGTWNPYLYSDEEPEICLRIRYAGYRILRLARPIVFHYSAPADSVSTLFGRRSRNLWLGFGQNIRYFLGSPLLWLYLRERGWAVVPALALSAGVIATVASRLTGNWRWLALWGACLAMVTIGIAIRKRSLKHGIFTIVERLLILEGTIRGLLLKPFDPAGYPGSYEVITPICSTASFSMNPKPALCSQLRQSDRVEK